MQKENIIIDSVHNNYEERTWVGEPTEYTLRSITVDFKKKGNYHFKGDCTIYTNKPLTEEEIKDKIMEVLK